MSARPSEARRPDAADARPEKATGATAAVDPPETATDRTSAPVTTMTDPALTDPALTTSLSSDPALSGSASAPDRAPTDSTLTDPTRTDPTRTDPTRTDPTRTGAAPAEAATSRSGSDSPTAMRSRIHPAPDDDLPADDQPPLEVSPSGDPGRIARFVRRHAGWLPFIASLVVSGAYLLAPRMGQDLAAQMARADFAQHFPLTPVDLRWFGGMLPFGYSAWTPAVMAVVGVRLTAAIATVIAVVAFYQLLRREGAPRPIVGGVIAAVTLSGNLTEGRTTFACGVAVGLLGLLCITRGWRFAAGVAALLAGLASPVAALFVLLVAGAFLLRRRVADALYLGVPAAVSLAATSLLFADSGEALVSISDAVRALLVTAVVFFVVPRRAVLLRIGAVLAFVMMAIAWQVPSPVGANATRLSLLFAVPLVAAYVRPERWIERIRPAAGRALKIVAVGTVVAVTIVQPPLIFGTIARAGGPETKADYYAPLLQQIQERGLTGRVEVPELIGHWEAAYMAREVPLARGWLRQTDTKLNQGIFYGTRPTVDTYLTFLQRNAVQYVAIADQWATFAGRPEVNLVNAGLPYLTPVWANQHWTLYEVRDPVPLVSAPARLLSEQPDHIVLTVPAPGDITVRVRYWRWLTVEGPAGACVQQPQDDLGDNVVVLHVTQPGRYTITSKLSWGAAGCG